MNSNRRSRFVYSMGLAVALLCAIPVPGWSQATTSLRGQITDAKQGAITEAAVRLENTANGFSRMVLSDASGFYQFAQIPPGVYTIRVEKDAFAPLERTGLELLVNTPATLNLALDVSSVSQTVNVGAELPPINAVDASIGNAFNEVQVRQLPLLTRNVVELLSLQPGVTPTGEVLGARRDQNNITLDGVDVNDNQSAGLETSSMNRVPLPGVNANGQDRPAGFNGALPVPLDSVQEFRVTVGGQGASQGRSSGGQVSLVTKSGTNNFHGSAYEFHRNTVTSANNWFNNRAGVKREQLVRNQFGASLGGRIVRDRAFFFGNFEQRIDASANSQLRTVPTETSKQGLILMQTNDGVTRTLTPDQIREIDPLRQGNNAAILDIFRGLPVGNDPAAGIDRGLNFSGFRFNAPVKLDNKAYVAKLDFRLDNAGSHNLSLRGTLADNVNDEVLAQYPGQAPVSQLLNNSRGISGLYTAVLKPNLINVVTAGLTRIGIERTGALGSAFTFDTIDAPTNYTRGFARVAPTYNIANDLTWTKGVHTVTAGANLRFVRNQRTNFNNAFPLYNTSRGYLAGVGSDITAHSEDYLARLTGNAGIRASSGQLLSRAFVNMLGVVSYGAMTYNYGGDGAALPIGTAPLRNFASNEGELYIADNWRVNPSLTLNFGLRYSKFGVPYETSGLQVNPLFPLQDFHAERLGGMEAGIPAFALPNALMQYEFAGPTNGKSSWYRPDNNNFAPRFSFAYSPQKQSGILHRLFGSHGVFRGGAAVVYDRFGSDLVTQFDNLGSFGLTEVTTLGQSVNFTTGTRYNGTPPAIPPAPAHVFPYTPPDVDYVGGVYMGIANDMRTPYSFVLNGSVSRELPGGLTMEVGYAGRLSRKLLMQIDAGGWAIMFQDPKSGTTWKEFAHELRRRYDSGVDPRAVANNPSLMPAIPFAENMFPGLANYYFPGSATANYFNLLWAQNGGSDADTMHVVDTVKTRDFPNCMSAPGCFTFYPRQAHSNSMWTNTGFAAFHAGTLTVRKPFSRGVAFDFNYTLSHAIDNGGAAESGRGAHAAIMLNPHDYGAFRGSSDFDIRHNVNANGLFELPFGRGRKFLGNAQGWLDQVVGGWQFSAIMRYRSGLPSAVQTTGIWPSNFSFGAVSYPVGPFDSKVQYDQLNNPSIFSSTTQVQNWRPMYPGEAGMRAAVRLDDLMNFDLAVAKLFRMPWEGHRIQFRAEAFNAFNNVNFFNPSLNTALPATFGQFSEATAPRVMQFALRYEF